MRCNPPSGWCIGGAFNEKQGSLPEKSDYRLPHRQEHRPFKRSLSAIGTPHHRLFHKRHQKQRKLPLSVALVRTETMVMKGRPRRCWPVFGPFSRQQR